TRHLSITSALRCRLSSSGGAVEASRTGFGARAGSGEVGDQVLEGGEPGLPVGAVGIGADGALEAAAEGLPRLAALLDGEDGERERPRLPRLVEGAVRARGDPPDSRGGGGGGGGDG